MSRTFITALSFFISCQVTEISDTIVDDGRLIFIYYTFDEDYGSVTEMTDGYYEIEMDGEIIYRMEPHLIDILNLDLETQGATILRMARACKRDGLLSYRSEKLVQIIEETVEAFAYSSSGNFFEEDPHIFPVLIGDQITPLHLN